MAQKPSSSKTPVTPTEGAAASAPSPATDTNRLQAVLARTSVESADVNAIRAVRRRAAAKTDPASSAVAAKPSAAKSSPTNEPTPRVATALPAPVASAASDAAVDETTVPDAIRQQFVQVGRKYYFPDGVRAFTDRGQRLTTPSENTAVIRSLVTIAQARGWDKIAVRGTSRFRREAWLAARLQGIEVRGYRPNGFEAAKLVRTLAERNAPASAPATASTSASDPTMRVTRAEGTAAERPAAPPRAMLAGELMDHGRATYQHDPHEPMSYFVKLLTARGERTIWGVDLERAFKESVTQPKTGDAVGLRAVRQDAVKVTATERDDAGQVIGERDLQTQRNRWVVEKRTFFDARAEAAHTVRDNQVDPRTAVTGHPELAGTYLQMRAAELAAQQFRNPKDRQTFVTQVRARLADAIARGEPLPRVQLRERAAERPAGRSHESRGREAAPVRS